MSHIVLHTTGASIRCRGSVAALPSLISGAADYQLLRGELIATVAAVMALLGPP